MQRQKNSTLNEMNADSLAVVGNWDLGFLNIQFLGLAGIRRSL